MAQNEINLSSLINKSKAKIREKDDFILSNANITKEELQKIDDEKYEKILNLIEETIKQKNQNDDKLKIEEDENWELFANYKSDFKKEENQFFKNLRKKKLKIKEKLRMPKTRVSLVIWLILLTITTISSLFILDPTNHSFKVYKANLLGAKNKYFPSKENKSIKTPKEIKAKTEIKTKQEQIIEHKLNTLTWSELEKFKQKIIRDALINKYEN